MKGTQDEKNVFNLMKENIKLIVIHGKLKNQEKRAQLRIHKKTPLYYILYNALNRYRQQIELVKWEKKGKPVPPPHIIKQKVLREYAETYGLKILVETGTYYGDMVEAMKKYFDQIYSIELSRDLYEKALKRFKGVENIELLHGDSAIELGNAIKKINHPALFWLDGHYSGGVTAKGKCDTPIYEELEHILSTQNRMQVIIIDDARCFGTDPAYPSIEELTNFVKAKKNNVNILVQDDIIRITPIL